MRDFSLAPTLLALVAATPLLAARQTTASVGQDLSNGSMALTSSAERNATPGDRR